MAGSYKHCCREDGSFRDNESFSNMIETLGDAYEACEEMHWMIDYLAEGEHQKITEALEEYYKFQLSLVAGRCPDFDDECKDVPDPVCCFNDCLGIFKGGPAKGYCPLMRNNLSEMLEEV